MFRLLLLLCLQRIQSQRTVSSIYHLLKGKKSIQTIQDSYLFKISNLFGVYPTLNRNEFDREILTLERKQYIKTNGQENIATLTEDGLDYLEVLESNFSPLYFNGLKLEREPEKLLQIIYLLTQTTSYLATKQNRFLPIIDDVDTQKVVKQYIKGTNLSMEETLAKIHDDLIKALTIFSPNVSELIVDTFTTPRQTGQTSFQLADKYKMSVQDIHLHIHHFAHYIYQQYTSGRLFQYLTFVYSREQESTVLTSSAKQTLTLFKKGFGISDIAHLRKLKTATIEDHIIELIYAVDKFDWQRFITKDMFQMIRNVIEDKQTVKLKILKNSLPEDITYFQIKLGLALYHKGEK